MEKEVHSRMQRRKRNFEIFCAERQKQLFENECGISETKAKIKNKYNDLDMKINLSLKDDTTSEPLNKFALITGTGSIISGLISVIGLTGVGASLLTLMSNAGYENTEEINRCLEGVSGAGETTANVSSIAAALAVACFGACTISLSLSHMLEICREKYNQLQLEKKQPLIEDMIRLDEILTMIEDLRKNKNDMSLNFIKDFLSSVNIQDNTHAFNYELLSKFAQYRVAVLKEMNGEQNNKEVEQKFQSIINFIYESPTLKGASSEFVTSPYINDLIRTYTFNQEEFDFEVQEEQPIRRRRR